MNSTKKPPFWLDEVLVELNAQGSRCYRKAELIELIRNAFPGVGVQVGETKVLETLLKTGLGLIDLRPAKRSRKTQESYKPIRRFTWGTPSILTLALSLREKSYLSHGTAAGIIGILEQSDQTLYVNKEQSSKPTATGTLTQDAIDRAFNNEARTSNYMYSYRGHQILLLNGKNTGNLGVIAKKGDDGTPLMVTRLERTLVDMAVRPQYAGGVDPVLAAFRKSAPTLSPKTLLEVLDGLDYRYPYHQSIGFYLSRSGFTDFDTQEFQARGVNVDFYLTNKMVRPLYDKKWRVFYPRLLSSSSGQALIINEASLSEAF